MNEVGQVFSRYTTYNYFVFKVRGGIQKFPDWPPGARIANGTALY